MNKVCACIDGLANTQAVIDWAAWAALRLQRPLEFLHVLERHPERAERKDYSGTIGPDAQDSLLQELSGQDEARSARAREAGRALLAEARLRAAAAGVTELDARLRHGDFVDTLLEFENEVDLFVLGEHYKVHERASQAGKLHSDHHLERAIRALKTPVLVATADRFETPQRIVLAFDGSANARRAADALTQHALRAELPVLVAMVGADTPQARRHLEEAGQALARAGLQVSTELRAGEAQQVLPQMAKEQGAALLVMGAYGHSRLRQWLLGSTTSTLLRRADVPVLILR
jgi:nucleotide-binding universal stress UspA family protein